MSRIIKYNFVLGERNCNQYIVTKEETLLLYLAARLEAVTRGVHRGFVHFKLHYPQLYSRKQQSVR
jgi:hypothetical protein